MDIFEFGSIVGGGERKVLEYFQEHGLIRRGAECEPCGRSYTLVKKKGSVTGFLLRCAGCKKKIALNKDAFFDGTHLHLPKLLGLMYFWAAETGLTQATNHLSISSATVVQWYQYFRDICSWKLLRSPLILGGVGKTIQIDESILVRAKYHRGRQLHKKQRWIFGIYDPEKREGYIQLVDKRDAATLLPIIQRIVAPNFFTEKTTYILGLNLNKKCNN